MLVVQPFTFDKSDEELATVCMTTRVSHREEVRFIVPHLEILILKFSSIDGFATCSIELCEISALGHEARDNSVED